MPPGSTGNKAGGTERVSPSAPDPAVADGKVATVRVPLGERAYDVRIGHSVRARLPGLVAALGASRAAVVAPHPWAWTPETGVATSVVAMPDGETGKTLAAVERLCRAFAPQDLTRDDVVVSVGGGSVTDVVGLAAAIYHHGVPMIHLPTSLLA